MRSILILAALIGLAAGGSMAATLPVETYTLPNGLTVILHRDTTTPTITTNIWSSLPWSVGVARPPNKKAEVRPLLRLPDTTRAPGLSTGNLHAGHRK